MENHIQQVSGSIKETCNYAILADFKFHMLQAQWHVKVFTFFSSVFELILIVTTLLHLSFPSGTDYFWTVFLFTMLFVEAQQL